MQSNSVTDVATTAPYGIMLLRVALGVMWLAHALLKLVVFTLPGTAAFFETVGLPGFLAYPVFAAELIGGVAVVGNSLCFWSSHLLPMGYWVTGLMRSNHPHH